MYERYLVFYSLTTVAFINRQIFTVSTYIFIKVIVWVYLVFKITIIVVGNIKWLNILFCTLFIYFDELFIHILVFVGESKVDVINIVEREYIFTICTVPVIIIVTFTVKLFR